jgi:HEAT repeat protein
VLAYAGSKTAAERVGAAIALAAHLRTSERLREDPRVQSALRGLLNDGRSRVRYRAAEVLRGFPALVSSYQVDLRWHAEHDENSYVRSMAQRALKRAGGDV